MRIETNVEDRCSWCRTTGVHATFLRWSWINRAGERKTPTMCGECWEKDVQKDMASVRARSAARQWTELEQQAAKRVIDEVAMPF